tara:strand:- start:1297 stop:1995 length:699 start_codon:yes stop_codon:yes gene_type:complete
MKESKFNNRVGNAMLGAIFFMFVILFTAQLTAGPTDDNHIHVEQVDGGDDLSLNITQIGYGNTINFSFAHADNTFNLTQNGSGNSISWVSYWGSGKSWGGDVDGSNNNETVLQYDGATYGRHIWGDNNLVDIYQNGSHTFNLDIHADDTDVELWQEGSGSHYAHTYFYGTADGSTVDLTQKGTANHNSQITLQGTEPTTLNLLQQGGTNQSYSITNTCFTAGGCTVNVSQGN